MKLSLRELGLVLGGVAFALLGAYVLFLGAQPALGSVSVSGEYSATSTYPNYGGSGVRVLRAAGGSTLGSYVITGKNTGLVTFYDATTSDPAQRAASMSTSSLLIADFPTNAPEGTYTIDAITKYGLLMVTTGSTATGTATFR